MPLQTPCAIASPVRLMATIESSELGTQIAAPATSCPSERVKEEQQPDAHYNSKGEALLTDRPLIH